MQGVDFSQGPVAYYNEVDPYAAQTLRNLIDAGEIPFGVVDTRDMRDVLPANLAPFTQCHFFAGVAVWALALRAAGWPDDAPIWTGSCPCQPFSAAGAGAGVDDERHLWPDWHWLIEQCRPQTVLGEQVASHDGLKWADIVSTDLEATGYTFGPVDTCAAGFGGYHIRQRLYFAGQDGRLACAAGQPWGLADGREWSEILENIWHRAAGGVGNADGSRRAAGLSKTMGQCGGVADVFDDGDRRLSGPSAWQSEIGGVEYASGLGWGAGRHGDHSGHVGVEPAAGREGSGVGNANGAGSLSGPFRGVCGQEKGAGPRHGKPQRPSVDGWPRPADICGAPADWLFCRDGSWRAVRPGAFPLVDAAAGRVGKLHAIGNALDLAQASAFVRAFMERDMGLKTAAPAADLFEWVA